MGEPGLIGKHRLQNARRLRRLDGPVKAGRQVRRGKMHPVIRRIGCRRYRGRIRCPHGRGRTHHRQQLRRLLRHLRQHRRLGPVKAQPPQRRHMGPLLGWQNSLQYAPVRQRLHLGQTLQRRLLRIRHLTGIGAGSQIAPGQASVIVGRTNQPVQVQFPAVFRRGAVTNGRIVGFHRRLARK